MVDVVDFTKALKDKRIEEEMERLNDLVDDPDGSSEDWSPAEAIQYAGMQVKEQEANKCLIVWLSPLEGEGEDETSTINYAVAGIGKTELFSLLVHMIKRHIIERF